MRTRLTVAILTLVVGTLVLTGVGSLVLVRRSTYTNAEQQLYTQARVVATLAAGQPQPGQTAKGVLSNTALIALVGDYRTLSVAALSADGSLVAGLPPALDGVRLHTAPLLDDQAVSGVQRGLVYVLIPLDLRTAQKQSLHPPIPYQDVAVLVATRQVRPTVTGLGWFAVVSAAALVMATFVAYGLASRFSRPLLEAVETTGRIAGGDLDARVPPSQVSMAEFAALATSINAMADRLQEARQQQRHFLLSISHDLRTPLTSIKGYAEAIAEGATDDVPHAVHVISAEAARLERLVGDLLDLARLDARRFSFTAEPVDLSAAVAAAVEGFGPEAAASSLTLHVATTTVASTTDTATGTGTGTGTDVAGPVALVDPDRLAQILANLLENAGHYASGRVEVGARRDGLSVELWVADDGPGIAPHDLPRVFEPHFSVDTASRRAGHGDGSGLGLAIVSELVVAMGGTVRAESPLGPHGGTRLSVRFPAAPPPR